MDKDARQLKIFKLFAEVAPLSILPESIENRKPPEPDILCEIKNCGYVGFELTELVDQRYMEHLGKMFHTKNFLYEYCNNYLDETESIIFHKKYCNADIHFEYSQESNLNSRKKIAEKVFATLLSLPDEAQGELLKNDQELLPVLKWIHISKSNISGPLFNVSMVSWLGDPTKQQIKKKFSKSYNCNYPIELLAHINWGTMPHDEVWRSSIESISKNLALSPFRKLWVFDTIDNQIKYEKSI